ncbi:UBP1-associated protein 2C [Spatholobus suberectus]|nr:UBP1-associated protein 2C [Spatholobus suberectus]
MSGFWNLVFVSSQCSLTSSRMRWSATQRPGLSAHCRGLAVEALHLLLGWDTSTDGLHSLFSAYDNLKEAFVILDKVTVTTQTRSDRDKIGRHLMELRVEAEGLLEDVPIRSIESAEP